MKEYKRNKDKKPHKTMKKFKLEPLSKTALSSQLYKLVGYGYDYNTTFDGKNYINEQHGHVFIPVTQEQEQQYKDEQKRLKLEQEEKARHKYDHIKHPFIDYNNHERWEAGLKEAEKQPFKVVEMCEDAYDHFLNCLPPKLFDGVSYMCSEPHSHNNKGQGVYICGYKKRGKFYAQYGTVQDYTERQLFKELPTY